MDDRPRVRIVGQPLADFDPFGCPAAQHVAARARDVDAFGDLGDRADVTADVTATDFTALRDQHHAEAGIVVAQAVSHQLCVAGFEDLQR